MTSTQCPNCGQTLTRVGRFWICPAHGQVSVETSFVPKRLFISYGHDEHASLARRLRDDLRARGHHVWFDDDRLQPGHDWEAFIERGLEHLAADKANSALLLLMTPHSVRRPDGYCLNEVARALSRGLRIIPLMVVESEPPLSICRIQWLDMRECIPIHEKEAIYKPRFQRLLRAIEEGELDFEGNQQRLIRALQPLEFDADILSHVQRFVGRAWVFEAIQRWLEQDPPKQRVFWICGGPGVGKTTLSAVLSSQYLEVAALHLCKFGHAQKSDPRRVVSSVAYQLSTQLPEYEALLSTMDIERLAQDDARTMFDNLLVQPLAKLSEPDRPVIILIDALDEASGDGRNALASFLATEFERTPQWLRLIVTSRPEKAVTGPLQSLDAFILDTEIEANRADIRSYLQRELAPLLRGRSDGDRVVEEILDRSEGVFLYAERVCHDLLLGCLSLDRLDEFPQGLGGVFWQYFERQFPDLQRYRTEIRPVLRAILAAREPLPLDLLQRLFHWEDEQMRDVTRSLGSLFPVSLSGEQETIAPHHKSLVDWLSDESTAGPYYVSVLEGHRLLSGELLAAYQSGEANRFTLAHLPAHLTTAQRADDVYSILTDYVFIRAKVEAGMVDELIDDYRAARTVWHAVHTGELSSSGETLDLIQGSLRLSAGALRQDPSHLSSQLTGRLLARPEETVQSILEEAREKTTAPWLRPLSASLAESGGPLMRILTGHRDWVRFVAVTADGLWGVSASDDETIALWDLEKGVEIGYQAMRDCGVMGVEITPDETFAFTIDDFGALTLRYLDDPGYVVNLPGDSWGTLAVALTPDGRRVVAGLSDKTLKLWDLGERVELTILTGHTAEVSAVAVALNGRRAVSGSYDKTVRVWDLDERIELGTLFGHEDQVYAVAVTPDGKRAVSGSLDYTVKVWDLEKWAMLASLTGHTGGVTAVAISQDGHRVVSASADMSLKVWDLAERIELATLTGHTGIVYAVAMTPDGRFAVSGSADGTLRMWDLEKAHAPTSPYGHLNRMRVAAVTPNGRHAVTGSEDNTLKVWDLADGAEQNTLSGHWSLVEALAVTPDGRRVISGSTYGTLMVWDLEKGSNVATVPDLGLYFELLMVTPDGQTAISVTNLTRLRLWDLTSGVGLKAELRHPGRALSLAITPDSRYVVSGSEDNNVRVWDLNHGGEPTVLTGHTDGVLAVAVTPDGQYALSGSADTTVKLWDLAAGIELATLTGHSDTVTCVAIAPDGRSAVSASMDKTLKVWDLEKRVELVTLAGHAGAVWYVHVLLDGKTAISRSWDRTLRAWDLERGAELAAFATDGPILSSVVDPADRTVVVGGGTGRVHFLRLENLPTRPQIVTAWSHPHDDTFAFGCVKCRTWSEIGCRALGTELECPNCGHSLRLNSFIIEGDWRAVARAWGDEQWSN